MTKAALKPIFHTKRLNIRELRPTDLNAFCELQCNPNVMRYITGKAMSVQEAACSLDRYMDEYRNRENVFRVWAVERRSDQVFIGTCALITMEGSTENDLGYRILEEFWGNGYASEIAHGLIQYAFEELQLPFLLADADIRNLASLKILDKTMNFIKEIHYPDEGCTARQYRLDRAEYFSALS